MRKHLLPIAALALAGLQVASAAPPAKTGTIRAKPNPVVFGRSVALSGRLTGRGNAGKTIQVEGDAYPYDGSFKRVATPVTNSGGDWAAIDKPAVNTRYRARQGSTKSGLVTELVSIAVGLKLSDRTPSAGARVRFSGQACPQHDGAPVRIQRRTASGSWRTAAGTTLRDLAGSTCSRYIARFRVSRDATYRTVVVSPDADHAGGRSPRRLIDVH